MNKVFMVAWIFTYKFVNFYWAGKINKISQKNWDFWQIQLNFGLIRRWGKKGKNKIKIVTLWFELRRIWDIITSSWKENLYRLHCLLQCQLIFVCLLACQCSVSGSVTPMHSVYVFQGKIHVIILFITFYRICYDTPDHSWKHTCGES